LAPISEERVGEAAGVTSATGSFGLSFGLAFSAAIMLATLSSAFTNMAESSSVLPPADQQRVADVLEDDAQVTSDAQLEGAQVALLVTLLAALVGVAAAFRMVRLPDPEPSTDIEGSVLG
jgi:hypothetical protein